MGLGHVESRPGDEVWIFYGGKVPFTVRPRDGDDDYDFVGHCGVRGIIHGEFFEKESDETRNIRSIRLH